MPRTLTRPIIGTPVWYFAAAPPAAAPIHAVVVAIASQSGSGVGSPPPTFDLAIYDPAASAGAGAWSKASAVPFHYGTRPTSGAWCTMPRVNQPAVGVWPSLSEAGALDYVMHDMNPDQKEAYLEHLHEVEAAQSAVLDKAKQDAKEAHGNPGTYDDEEDDDDPAGEMRSHPAARTRTTTTTRARTTHR